MRKLKNLQLATASEIDSFLNQHHSCLQSSFINVLQAVVDVLKGVHVDASAWQNVAFYAQLQCHLVKDLINQMGEFVKKYKPQKETIGIQKWLSFGDKVLLKVAHVRLCQPHRWWINLRLYDKYWLIDPIYVRNISNLKTSYSMFSVMILFKECEYIHCILVVGENLSQAFVIRFVKNVDLSSKIVDLILQNNPAIDYDRSKYNQSLYHMQFEENSFLYVCNRYVVCENGKFSLISINDITKIHIVCQDDNENKIQLECKKCTIDCNLIDDNGIEYIRIFTPQLLHVISVSRLMMVITLILIVIIVLKLNQKQKVLIVTQI